MAKTISELRNQSIQVRDASAAGENTATRVGTVLNDIVGHIEDYENTQSSNNSSQDAKIEGVKSSLNAEIARAKTEESNLSTQIDTERTERQAAVSREETARIQADNDEKQARINADNAEQDARIKADNDEKTARENADITLRTMIQTEVSNRQIAVKQEEIRAMAAEKANTQAIEDENARATTAEENETARAMAEEERLQDEIDNTNVNLASLEDKVNSNHNHVTDEVARLDTTDNEIKVGLEAEVARAKAAEEANAQAIADETARATAAEEANAQAIADETARATAAEEANAQAITDETARATAAEEAIIFDVSAHNNGAVFESLQALLSSSNLSTLIPQSVRHGGMTIRFIQGSEQSSNNKYVQYFCNAQEFTTDISVWEKVNLKKEVNELGQEVKNIYRNSDGVDLESIIERYKTFANTTIGTKLTLEDSQYRDVRKFIIHSLKGVVVANKIQLKAEDVTKYAVITDIDNTVIAVESMTAATSSYFIPINVAKYGDSSYYLYIVTENSQATFVCKFFSDSGIEALGDDMLVGINNREFNYTGNIPYLPANYSIGLILDSPVVGNPVALKYGRYRWCGIALLRKYIGCKICVNYINAESGNGCVLVDEDGIIIASFTTTTGTPQNKEIDLTDYPNARYLYWEWSDNYPTSVGIIQRGNNPETQGIEEDFYGYPSKTISFVNHNNKIWPSDIAVGNTFTIDNADTTDYRAIGEIDVSTLRGDVNIKGILPSRGNIIVTDIDNKVVLVRNDSSYSAKTIETNVNLKDYPTASKIWFVAPLSNDYPTYGTPEVTNYYDGLETRVSEIESGMPKNGVLLLHFDSPLLSVNDRRLQLMKQYKFNVSWCIAKGVFGDDDTFANWGSNDYKNAYWDAIKRGDDVGLYPAKIATEYDEAGWDSYLDTALANLAINGIHNITGFMCSRLDINDDLLNSVKKHNFKVIRGGGAKDPQSVDTYNYTKKNTYMSNVLTMETFFVNASTMFGNDANYTSYVQYIKSLVYYAIRTNTAISLFAHSVNPDGTSRINITEEHLIAILDMINAAVQNDGLKIMTWKQWYSCVNRVDGHFWDENRLMKMCVAEMNI